MAMNLPSYKPLASVEEVVQVMLLIGARLPTDTCIAPWIEARQIDGVYEFVG